MKKLIIVKVIIVLILVGIGIFLNIKYYDVKNKNDELRFKITKTKMNIDKSNMDVDISKANIEKLKEEKKDSIWELDSWKLMKEKIERAL